MSLSTTVTFSEITSARIPQITFAQSGILCFFVIHFFPVILKRTGLNTFVRQQYAFETSLDGNKTFQPYYNFQSAGVTITLSYVKIVEHCNKC